MTITNRLTLFFQIALGLVLIGFSLALYSSVSWHLHSQADRHLRSAMDLLIAAIEVHSSDVEWEPLERNVTLGDSADPTAVRWTLRDESGQLVDCSANVSGVAWPDRRADWRLLASQLSAGQFRPTELDPQTLQPSAKRARPLPQDRSAKRSKFLLTVGLSNGPIRSELLALSIALFVISIAAWGVAGICAQGLCRRALRPVHEMAQTARRLQSIPDSDSLLSVPATNDELTDLGKAFNGLLETLRESIERQARFAGDASHQLRTPLTATQTAVDVALRRERSTAEYQRVLAIVQRRNRELTNIVETLLEMARQPSQDATQYEIIDLARCCRERVEAMVDHPRTADLRLQICDAPVLVPSDPVLVSQIIDNLLDNACKYSKAGTPVTVQVAREGRDAVISVVDQGNGIAAQELSQVFEPFFRSPQARWNGSPGIGLGLAIASRFALLAGGRLEVTSELGVGAKFRLLFPAPAYSAPAVAGSPAHGAQR